MLVSQTVQTEVKRVTTVKLDDNDLRTLFAGSIATKKFFDEMRGDSDISVQFEVVIMREACYGEVVEVNEEMPLQMRIVETTKEVSA